MKRVLWIVTVLALSIAAAWLVPELAADPGMLRIDAFGWVLETTVPALLLGLLLLVGLIWSIGRLWALPRRVRRRAARRGLERGLLALAEGDFPRAEKTLQRTALRLNSPAAWLAAASAVRGSDADRRRERYLEAADDGRRRTRFLIALTRARLLLGDERVKEALALLKALRSEYPRHPELLRLMYTAASRAGEWRALLPVLPDLERQKAAARDNIIEIAAHALRQSSDGENAERIWRALPVQIRRQPAVLAASAEASLAKTAENGQAGSETATADEQRVGFSSEPVRRVRRRLESALDRAWQPLLLTSWEKLARGEPKAALKKANRWLRRHPADPDLLTALARLCRALELRGKANEYYRQALAIRPEAQLEREYRNALDEHQSRLPPPSEPAALPGFAAGAAAAMESAEKSNES